MLLFLAKCVLSCCLEHGLPEKCLEEGADLQTDVTHHNTSHTVIKTVISKECHKFKSVMETCKDGCITPVLDRKGKNDSFKFFSIFNQPEILRP